MDHDKHTNVFPMDKNGQEIMPFCVGSVVLVGTRGQVGEIDSFASGVLSTKVGYSGAIGGCTIRFEAEGESVLIPFTSLGRGKGGARLRRPPPSLRPRPRVAPAFAYSEALKERVNATYHAECATSPCTRDLRVKRVPPHVQIKVPLPP